MSQDRGSLAKTEKETTLKKQYIAPGMTLYEAAQYLGISQSTLYKYAFAGLVGTRITSASGKRGVYRYSIGELEVFRKDVLPHSR